MNAKRRFLYYLKMRNGRLIHAEGESAEDAAIAAGVKLRDVKRHMPVKALLTVEELRKRAERFEMLRNRKPCSYCLRSGEHDRTCPELVGMSGPGAIGGGLARKEDV